MVWLLLTMTKLPLFLFECGKAFLNITNCQFLMIFQNMCECISPISSEEIASATQIDRPLTEHKAENQAVRKTKRASLLLRIVKIPNKVVGKAQNVIEPKLQTKKIVLREQLKTGSGEGEALTKRKRSIHDVLTALNHHNTNTKTDALSGLYELITTEYDAVGLHLGKIIDKVAQLTSDLEGSVRRENLRVAEVLLSQVSEEQLQPFWNLLLTHLRCTLTDLNHSVRQSCVSFVTMLIAQCPNLVATTKSNILPAMLNLISSTTKTPTSSQSSTATTTTKLKVDIEDKTTEIRERIRILSLLSTCLNLKSNESCSSWSEVTSNESCGNSGVNSIYAELYYPYGYSDENMGVNTSCNIIDLSQVIEDSMDVDSMGKSNSYYTSEAFLDKFIHICLPILCETWVEVAPSSKSSSMSKKIDGKASRKRQAGLDEHQDENASHLNKNAVEVLKCVVEVMVNLLNLGRPDQAHKVRYPSRQQKDNSQQQIRVEKCESQGIADYVPNQTLVRELRKTFGQDLQKYFFHFLPFSCVQDSQRNSMVTVNLQLFHIASSLRLIDRHLMDEFEKYVIGLMRKDFISPDQVALVLQTTRLIRVPRIGSICTKFMVFAIEARHQNLTYKFMEKILALKSTTEDAKFSESIDWQHLYPYMIGDLRSENKASLISVLTLMALKHHLSLGPVLEENIQHFRSILLAKEYASSESIYRLFYYSNSLHLIADLFDEQSVNC
ncbi:unnamed protein product [Allacma fusca]|uniref:Pre-rRNA-processing protein Ipi1 N-terminal domain-containing protein n=1 Tax=Allacma fusca TaxID=39272 RepID=A0A8J2NIL5_9HEXA|nr:unnamed protein product [Allacma fusca]